MSDLAKRKKMADFGTSRRVHGVECDWCVDEYGEELIRRDCEGVVHTAIHYESDPAAACSLLPKLAVAYSEFPDDWASFATEYPSCIWTGEGVCEIIYDMIELLERLKK